MATDHGDGRPPQSYGNYLHALDRVWAEFERLLTSKRKDGHQHGTDVDPEGLSNNRSAISRAFRSTSITGSMDLIIWQKQTSKAMLGPYLRIII